MRRLLEDLIQAAAAAAAGLLLVWSGTRLSEHTATFDILSAGSLTDLQSFAALAASAAGLLVLAWWTVGMTAGFISALLLRFGKQRAARTVGRFSPEFLRRLAAAALGLQVASVPMAALAVPPPGPAESAAGSPAAAVAWGGHLTIDPLWQPLQSSGSLDPFDPHWKPASEPVSGPLPSPPSARWQAPAHQDVTVTAGDTLWALAAAQLGPLATDAEIASHWPAWFELNRAVIGADPHVLQPGQVLAVPPLPAD